MQPDNEGGRPRSTASIFGHPIHAMLVPFPVVCFVGTFVTDIVYSRTANLQWQYFSIWLLAAGLVFGGLAAVVGFVDYFGDRRVRRARPANWHMGLNLLAWLLSLLNAFVHSRDGWTAVVPEGLILSGIVVLLLLVSGWLGQSLVYRHGVGVKE
jgi:uncharacterized membrane protein